MLKPAEDLLPGDQFIRDGVTVTVESEQNLYRDQFGRDMFRYWCKRDDTDAEGWCSFGPGGTVVAA